MPQILDRRVRKFQQIKAKRREEAIKRNALDQFRARVIAKMEELKANGAVGPHLESIAKGMVIREKQAERRAVRS